MTTTARELNGNLIIDFGDGTDYMVYPVPGKIGIEIQAILVGITMGTTGHEHGADRLASDTEKIAKLALGVPVKGRTNKRWAEFDKLRSARATVVSQAAILWNTGGGGIDAVMDLLEEGGGYPKALGRVMQSSGLGDQWKILRTWLDGVGLTSATASTPNLTGGLNTSV
ncbi:hypothetical protein G7068_12015 [Leucobacter viscericola]|uniref:Uncharacterized protein n=1 Tax=Leucobacter viscericola TaxID=2714935 RepID=A0A6G7XGZ4_9MICO|nr:hypothetical protein [Leucobacter viscericola]QIK63835.1 hypothetical protein G7068_12015 [Leucobacter viscericola]